MRLRSFRRRGLMAAVFMLGAGLLFLTLLYDAQIRNGIDIDVSTAANTIATTERVEAARGEITDRYGRLLVSDQTVYNVTLDLGAMGAPEEQVATIRRLLEICREQRVYWNRGSLPVTAKEGEWVYASDTPFSYQKEDGSYADTQFARLCTAMEWTQLPNDPAGMLRAMFRTFSLEGEEGLELLEILYPCYLREKEIVWTTWYFAEDVDIDFISVVKEEGLAGVNIKAAAERVYHTPYAAHLLGQVGLITAENWEDGENYKAQGYAMDATVGISGVEYAFEHWLRGTSGTAQRITGLDGTLLSESYRELPEAGDSVALTLDIKLQEAAEQALAEHTFAINGGEGGSAVVVLDVTDGSLLASASYPTYDLARYRAEYHDLLQNELRPLYNRALLGTYAPGSTYKLVTATAGLSSGLITTDDEIDCDGWLDYLDTRFHCWIYRQDGRTHGHENVTEAIRDSCNIFFYTLGSRLGIDTLNDYARQYGLGLPTGIELSESEGVNAGPDYSERVGMIWYPGNTLSASIGQSDNQFTPLQICNYIATVVNGGYHYETHLLRSVKSGVTGELVYAQEKVLLNEVPLAEDDRAALLSGMAQVVESTTTVREAFSGLTARGIRVGAKTGSAQVTGQTNANGLFVCFAPYEDPEIAICVAVEKGGSGAATAVIAAEIMEYYFSDAARVEGIEGTNVLLR